VVERLLHTQEVAGSNPASRTPVKTAALVDCLNKEFEIIDKFSTIACMSTKRVEEKGRQCCHSDLSSGEQWLQRIHRRVVRSREAMPEIFRETSGRTETCPTGRDEDRESRTASPETIATGRTHLRRRDQHLKAAWHRARFSGSRSYRGSQDREGLSGPPSVAVLEAPP
jgi:hypothetical protein